MNQSIAVRVCYNAENYLYIDFQSKYAENTI